MDPQRSQWHGLLHHQLSVLVDPRTLVPRADAALQRTAPRSDLSAAAREAAAREFRELAALVPSSPAHTTAVVQALDDPALRRTAARLAAMTQDPDLCRLLMPAVPVVPLDTATLRLLAETLPPSETLALAAEAPATPARALRGGAAAHANESPLSQEALASLLRGDRSAWATGMSVLLRLEDEEGIRIQWSAEAPEDDPPPEFGPDRQTICALYLALLGDEAGVHWLVQRSRDPGPSGSLAVVQLARLGRPEAVPLVVERVHRQLDDYQAGFLLDACAALASAALLPLLALPPFDSVREDADVVARDIGGESQHLDPRHRYRAGRPLKLAHLVDDLLSPHEGPRTAGALSLRASTGKHHGFDLDLDLPANLDALDAWRQELPALAVPQPGAWAWRGEPLPGPSGVA